MGEEQRIKTIEADELLNKVTELSQQGYRLVQMGCTKLKYFELNYSFDKDMEFINLRLNILPEYEVNSITSIYEGAFLYENEIHDLFGVKFRHINIDYSGNLYKIAVKTPFDCDKDEK